MKTKSVHPVAARNKGRIMYALPTDIHGKLDSGLMRLAEDKRKVPHEVIPVAVLSLDKAACEARVEMVARIIGASHHPCPWESWQEDTRKHFIEYARAVLKSLGLHAGER